MEYKMNKEIRILFDKDIVDKYREVLFQNLS